MKKAPTPKVQQWLTDEGFDKIRNWLEQGATDAQLARKMGIHRDTLYDWQKKYEMLKIIMAESKGIVDDKVENSLLQRALGYKYSEITEVVDKNNEVVETKRVYKEEAPNVSAQIFWLKNRRRKEWRDSQLSYLQEEQMKLDNQMKELALKAMKGEVETNPVLNELVKTMTGQLDLEELKKQSEENRTKSEAEVSGNETV